MQISTETKILLAKELKINFKFIRYALLIGIISIPIFFNYYGGFTHIKMYNKYKNRDTSYDRAEFKDLTYYEKLDILQNEYGKLKEESEVLGWYYSNYRNPQDYHKFRYKHEAIDAFISSLKIVLIAWLIIILSRYIIIGARWVDDTSKKKVT